MIKMTKNNLETIYIVFLIAMISIFAIIGIHMIYLHNYTIPSTQNPPLSDIEYMRIGINNYFMSNFDTLHFPPPDYDVVLEYIAIKNAIEGKDLIIPTSANTAEEALKTFIAVDQSIYTCNQASFWIDTNKKDYPNTRYAIGVYKTSYNQYNVSIVIKRYNPDTQELNRNGAFVTVKHEPSIINFKGCM